MGSQTCGKFGDCSFSRFGSVARTNSKQTKRHTDTHERFTLGGVSNDIGKQNETWCKNGDNNLFQILMTTVEQSAETNIRVQ